MVSPFDAHQATRLPVGVLGGFLALQTSRVKFAFAEEDLEVVIGDAPTEDQPENAFVGGERQGGRSFS